MTDMMTVSGVVATEPRHLTTHEGLAITSFRLASAQRRYNRQSGTWIDGETNWYTVTSFRQTAINVAGSVHKGDRVILRGKLRVRPWQSSEKSGISVEIEAESIGHDLLWGTTAFHRTLLTSTSDRADAEARESAASGPSEGSPAGMRSGWALPGSTGNALASEEDGVHAEEVAVPF
ncbi:hypothetical protein GCM10022198_07930 [Klugiella xanthotipulae]|uniref:Single-strand DNA-binding protein n=1 Tax=Klugiella xanthotipulae TaxID=244735 RepID=A0A543HSY2_9MICO|nr:single-stranded DNA-binding protein [Klugiella xanthotipulae]TQM61447.1 single-strand DNA-binding protein [Klugiella xanthotipulae]